MFPKDCAKLCESTLLVVVVTVETGAYTLLVSVVVVVEDGPLPPEEGTKVGTLPPAFCVAALATPAVDLLRCRAATSAMMAAIDPAAPMYQTQAGSVFNLPSIFLTMFAMLLATLRMLENIRCRHRVFNNAIVGREINHWTLRNLPIIKDCRPGIGCQSHSLNVDRANR